MATDQNPGAVEKKPTLTTKGNIAGRPKGTGSANADTKMLRVIITPRQARLLALLRSTWGMSESEHARRALDKYLDELLATGELVDPGPAVAPAAKIAAPTE